MNFSNGPGPKEKKLTNEDEQDKPLNIENEVEDENQMTKSDEQTPEKDEDKIVLESDFPEDKQDDIEK